MCDSSLRTIMRDRFVPGAEVAKTVCVDHGVMVIETESLIE